MQICDFSTLFVPCHVNLDELCPISRDLSGWRDRKAGKFNLGVGRELRPRGVCFVCTRTVLDFCVEFLALHAIVLFPHLHIGTLHP